MISSVPTLDYDRPLAPGTVRITRSSGDARAVTIMVAPDTAKRTLYTLTRPLAVGGIICLIPVALFENRTFPPVIGITVFLAIAGVTLLACYRIIARSDRPIIFRADPAGIQILNPLDHPASRYHAAEEIITLQLRRISLLTEPVCYQLELGVHAFMRDQDGQSLLISQSAATLDRIGRALCDALDLAPPVGDTTTWSSTYLSRPGSGRAAIPAAALPEERLDRAV
jgi:hypothetical protein